MLKKRLSRSLQVATRKGSNGKVKANAKVPSKSVKEKGQARMKAKVEAKRRPKTLTAKAKASTPSAKAKKLTGQGLKKTGRPRAQRCNVTPVIQESKAKWASEAAQADPCSMSESSSPHVAARQILGEDSRIKKDEAGWIARQFGLEPDHVAGAVRLFHEGSTLPFIARYRKEQTGSMNEEDLRRVERELGRVKELEVKRARVALALQRGKHLTPELTETLLQAESVEDIEGLWAPFKAKRKTRAQVAKSLGLEPLAMFLASAANQAAPASSDLDPWSSPMHPMPSPSGLEGEVLRPPSSPPASISNPVPEDLASSGVAAPSESSPPPRAPGFADDATSQTGRALASAVPPAEAAKKFISPELPDVASVLKAARDILAEQFAQRADVRQLARERLERLVRLQSRRRAESDGEEQFKTYWEFSVLMQQVRPYQFLALQRGEQKKALSLSFVVSPEAIVTLLDALQSTFFGGRERSIRSTPTPLRAATSKPSRSQECLTAHQAEIRLALEDAFKRLLLPSLEREWRRRLKQHAEDEAFDTYRRNLKKKLLTAPLRLHPDWGAHAESPVSAVLGLDPAFRSGCKCALISLTGDVLATKVIYPHPSSAGASVPAPQAHQASSGLHELLTQGLAPSHEQEETEQREDVVEPPQKRRCLEGSTRIVCSLGNGTASRETEAWLRKLLKDVPENEQVAQRVGYAIVDESGASIYSASKLAGAELPHLDVSLRGAVSIARRLLDPLSELVKIDPRSIGVGLYQHDVDQKRLRDELRGATMDCVNAVGVDLNTASPALLEHVSGLTSAMAQNIVRHRRDVGRFNTRADLLKVRGVGPRTFEQAAGFLRIFGGHEPLDELPIHPESYSAAANLQQRCGAGESSDVDATSEHLLACARDPSIASELGLGRETLADLCTALASSKASLDPRSFEPPLRIKMPGRPVEAKDGEAIDAQEAGFTADQLKIGQRLLGVVRNVVAFGAFIDVGVGHDGLLHISKYPSGKAAPLAVNSPVEVTVLSAESRQDKGGKMRWRIGLSMRDEPKIK